MGGTQDGRSAFKSLRRFLVFPKGRGIAVVRGEERFATPMMRKKWSLHAIDSRSHLQPATEATEATDGRRTFFKKLVENPLILAQSFAVRTIFATLVDKTGFHRTCRCSKRTFLGPSENRGHYNPNDDQGPCRFDRHLTSVVVRRFSDFTAKST